MEERNENMKTLTQHQLNQIDGGASFGLAAILVAGAIFLIGVIDGYFRPLKCN